MSVSSSMPSQHIIMLTSFFPHTDYLGFSWKCRNINKWHTCLVPQFVLSSACYIFTKITRALIKKWQGEGKQILMYLDNG